MNTNPPSQAILRHGAYIGLGNRQAKRDSLASAAIPLLAARLGFANEFDASSGHPDQAIAFLARVDSTPAQIPDEALLHADAIVHVASKDAAPVTEFCAQARQLLGSFASVQVLTGVVKPTNYTGGAMHKFAYEKQVQQQSGSVMPNAFLLPMSKTAEWWTKDWMERHTYFLPRFDESGRMRSEGHALAAAPGIPCLMRRTYKSQQEPASDGGYDFLNYFECAGKDIPVFHQVCAALRDLSRNPEWRFVREGPTWHGRRVRTWPELFQ